MDTFHHVDAAPQAAVLNQPKDLWLGLGTCVLDAAAAAGARLGMPTAPVLAADDPVHRGVGVLRRSSTIAAWADEDRGGSLGATGYVLDQGALLTDLGLAAVAASDLRAARASALPREPGAVGLGVRGSVVVPVSG